MMTKKNFSLKAIILVFFIVGILLLTIPLTFLLNTRNEAVKQKKEEPTPTPAYFTPGPGIIAGYVYDDLDKDGERNAEEQPIEGIIVRIKQINQHEETKITTITTDSQGYFRSRFTLNPDNPTSFTVNLVLPEEYKTNNANPILIADLRPGRDRILEFGIFSTKTQPKADSPLVKTPSTITPKQATP